MRILTIILIAISSFAFGQTPELKMTIFTYSEDSSVSALSGTSIILISEDTIYKSTITDSLGKAELTGILYNHQYTLKISKSGYLTKVALLDLNTENTKKVRQFEQPLEVRMEKVLAHENFLQLDTIPLIKFNLDSEIGILSWTYLNKNWLPEAKGLCADGLTFDLAIRYVTLLNSAHDKALLENYVGAVQELKQSLEIIDSEAVKKEMVQLLERARIKYYQK